ncbi:MAG: TfoX/Sxy family protein [Saprospiraceae bacterium]|nr:TfoX/Sxy family protein [Saprospiraceae bacterium]
MAYSEWLADRIRSSLNVRNVGFEEKRMMGGLTFMVKGKMCVGVHEERLMARIGPEPYEGALSMKGCQKMDFTGREMRGYVFVDPDGTDLDEDLEVWMQMALDFNQQAKAYKKRKKK